MASQSCRGCECGTSQGPHLLCPLHHTKMIFLKHASYTTGHLPSGVSVSCWLSELQVPGRVSKFLALAELFAAESLPLSSHMAELRPLWPSFSLLLSHASCRGALASSVTPGPTSFSSLTSFSCSFGDLLPGPLFSTHLQMVQDTLLGVTVTCTNVFSASVCWTPCPAWPGTTSLLFIA